MRKVTPHPTYPPEEGRYLRGNDFSPVTVAIILTTDEDKIPRSLEQLVRVGLESGAALSGTVQTPNIGLEKMICNIVANPNIRYLILGGPESAGHLTGEALKALFLHGIDEKHRIIGTNAPYPVLYNLTLEIIERFLRQVTLIDLQFQGDPELIRQAVWSCYQEQPVEFRGQQLHDPGAFDEEAIGGSLTWRVTRPWCEPTDDSEREALRKMQQLIACLRERTARRREGNTQE
ncbi:MAG: tetrahydromethanopterin S-methyltransferase subunit A [Armatimonadota bacterium]